MGEVVGCVPGVMAVCVQGPMTPLPSSIFVAMKSVVASFMAAIRASGSFSPPSKVILQNSVVPS